MKTPFYRPSLNVWLARWGVAPRYIAGFDSTAAMLRALSSYLHRRDFPGLGILPTAAEGLGLALNRLPAGLRERIYILFSGGEGIRADRLREVRAEAVSQWIASIYPRRAYPAVAVGSASGALVHLCAALRIPWLPQTFLIPVSHSEIHPDEPAQSLEWGKRNAQALLEANPDLKLHHMHDANQDRLTLQRIQYFRVKRMRLGRVFERFLERSLTSNGIIFLVECQRRWPTTRVNERHVFQHGALGGATPEEFLRGSERVELYLERYGSHRRRWISPEPDSEEPEAEWGFEPSLREDVERLARRRGLRLHRIVFEEPEHLSPFVAELYRWWYEARRISPRRLLIQSFIHLEPYWTLRTGSVPFWMKFNMEPSREWALRYLDESGPFEEIYMTLFAHGVRAVGLPSIEAWNEVTRRATRHGEILGIDAARFPLDLAAAIRYHTEIKRKIRARYPLPGALSLRELERFTERSGARFPVRWLPSM